MRRGGGGYNQGEGKPRAEKDRTDRTVAYCQARPEAVLARFLRPFADVPVADRMSPSRFFRSSFLVSRRISLCSVFRSWTMLDEQTRSWVVLCQRRRARFTGAIECWPGVILTCQFHVLWRVGPSSASSVPHFLVVLFVDVFSVNLASLGVLDE